MTIQTQADVPILLERVVYIGLISNSIDACVIRNLCWRLGALTVNNLNDSNISHILFPNDHCGGDIIADEAVIFAGPLCVRSEWIVECSKVNACVDEAEFLVDNIVLKPAGMKAVRPPPSTRALSYRSTDAPIMDRTKAEAARSAITRRRSDISSVPLRPNGVFQGVELSLLGWSDARTEASLSYQITTNGGAVVPFGCASQYACVCSDGSRPTRQTDLRLVSQRWINDCLAAGSLVDPSDRITYTPSSAQLPLLMMKNLCLYLTEKDATKLEVIQDIARLCGIRCVVSDGSNSSVGTRISAITHFIFHDLASLNRRRDLVPLAKKSNKFLVSYEWLKELYVKGVRPDESLYDPSVSLFTLTDSVGETQISSPCLPDELPPQVDAGNSIVWENKHTVQLTRRTQ